MRFAAKRFLDRIVSSSDGARRGGISSPIDDAQLMEALIAVDDLGGAAESLHLLREPQFRDDLSALAGRIRIQLETIRKSESTIAEMYAKAHAEHKAAKRLPEEWFRRVPSLDEYSNRARSASLNLIKMWSDDAAALLVALERQ